jgi:hypothetical protein
MNSNENVNIDLQLPTLPPQPIQLLSTITNFFASIPGLETQYQQIYTDIRGVYLSNSLSDTAAAVLSSAQGRVGQSPVSPGTLIRACIAFLEVPLHP